MSPVSNIPWFPKAKHASVCISQQVTLVNILIAASKPSSKWAKNSKFWNKTTSFNQRKAHRVFSIGLNSSTQQPHRCWVEVFCNNASHAHRTFFARHLLIDVFLTVFLFQIPTLCYFSANKKNHRLIFERKHNFLRYFGAFSGTFRSILHGFLGHFPNPFARKPRNTSRALKFSHFRQNQYHLISKVFLIIL